MIERVLEGREYDVDVCDYRSKHKDELLRQIHEMTEKHDGGCYGRLWLKVQGRGPRGLIPPADYEQVRAGIRCKLETMLDHAGRPLNTICYKREDIYRQVRNVPSDLLIYFGNLHWRSVGSLGHPGIYTFGNDTGSDDANHGQDGLIIYFDPKQPLNGKRLQGLQLMEIAPTILQLMDQPVLDDMQGRVIRVWA